MLFKKVTWHFTKDTNITETKTTTSLINAWMMVDLKPVVSYESSSYINIYTTMTNNVVWMSINDDAII